MGVTQSARRKKCLARLAQTQVLMKTRIGCLEILRENNTKLSMDFKAKGQRTEALFHLKIAVSARNEREKLFGQLFTIGQMTNAIESNDIVHDYLSSMKMSAKMLRETSNSIGKVDIDEIIEEIQNAEITTNEVFGTMAQHITDEDVQAEFDALSNVTLDTIPKYEATEHENMFSIEEPEESYELTDVDKDTTSERITLIKKHAAQKAD